MEMKKDLFGWVCLAATLIFFAYLLADSFVRATCGG